MAVIDMKRCSPHGCLIFIFMLAKDIAWHTHGHHIWPPGQRSMRAILDPSLQIGYFQLTQRRSTLALAR